MSRSLRRRFTRLTLLNILANVTVPLVGLVDAGMLGHLPDLRFLAAVALASILFDYLFWSLNFLRLATTGLTAQARGRGDPAGATRILYRALVLAQPEVHALSPRRSAKNRRKRPTDLVSAMPP